MATIYDIAKAAGVSHTTVSRVLNGNGYVASETRDKVLRVMEEMGFYPNELARGLVSRKTRTVALIVSDITNPFFTTIARGAEDIAMENGYGILLCNTDENLDKEKDYLELVLRKRLDGVLLASAARDGQHLKRLLNAKVPLVLMDRRLKDIKADVVRADGYQGAKKACLHLLEKGHRRIALFSGPLFLDVMNERFHGYLDALAQWNLEFDGSLVFSAELKYEAGATLAAKVLSMEHRPTAVVCTNSSIGLGAYAALRESGVAIPGGMSVIVFDFDAVDMYSRAFPYITSVSQPAYEIGSRAMNFLLERMGERGHLLQEREEILPAGLLVRSSS